MIANAQRLLIVDDEVGIREFVRDVAEDLGFAVIDAGAAEELFAAYQAFAPNVIVLDLMMPDIDGVTVLRSLAERSCSAGIILMSGVDAKVLTTAARLGRDLGLKILGNLHKPVRVEDLEALLGQGAKPESGLSKDQLESAIEKRELTLHYQPKVSLGAASGWPVEGVEALVRWEHPQRGLVAPADFIPLAEETGLIRPLTDFVVEAAIAQMSRWRAGGLDISVAVNLAPQLLNDSTLPDRFAALLKGAGVEPKRLFVEITESAAMADTTTTTEILTRFRLKDIGLSLDDFGTGYSSLIELYRMPFSEMKIDKSFVSEMEKDEEARIIVHSIQQLAKNLGLMTCAEGVESESALRYLSEIGCDRAQGYFISKPRPPREIPDFIHQWENDDKTAVASPAAASAGK